MEVPFGTDASVVAELGVPVVRILECYWATVGEIKSANMQRGVDEILGHTLLE